MNQETNIQNGFIPLLIVIIISVVIASGIGYSAIEYHKTSKIIKETEQLSKEEKYEEAIKKLENAQKNLLGKIIFKQKINNEISINKKLLEDKSEYTQGIEEFNKENWEKAKELLSKVSENSPYYQDAKNKIEEAQRKIIEKQIVEKIEETKETRNSEEEIQKLEDKIKELEQKLQQRPPSNTNQITEQEIQEILPYVGRITCVTKDITISDGSATFWGALLNQKNVVLTNAHLLVGEDLSHCISYFDFDISSELKPWFFSRAIDIIAIQETNSVDFLFLYAPFATSKLYKNKSGMIGDVLSPSLDSPLSQIPPCKKEMPLGSPVVIIGYPVGAVSILELQGESYPIKNKTLTTGVISAHNKSPLYNGYPDVNYFVSAKIDKGNSGGLALSKINGQLCILGIPTWVERGFFENMGIVQSLRNILNIED